MNDDTSFIGFLRSRLACATDAERKYERPMNWDEADRLLVAFDAALAKARNAALEDAATWHDEQHAENAVFRGLYISADIGEMHARFAAAIRAMKREPVEGHGFQTTPVAGHEGPAVTHKSEAGDD